MENKSFYENLNSALISVLCRNPQAYAEIKGSKNYKSISGIVKFYQTANGVLVYAVATGLPNGNSFHGFTREKSAAAMPMTHLQMQNHIIIQKTMNIRITQVICRR